MSEKKYKPQLIARESAIKILYQMKIQDETLKTIMNGFVEKREYDESLLEKILSKYVENKNSIIISSFMGYFTNINFCVCVNSSAFNLTK